MVSFIFTNALDQFRIRKQSEWYGSTPWLRVSLGVVECDLHLHPAEVDSAETFRHPQCFSVRTARIVEPTLIVETATFRYEYVALPLPYRISKPARSRFGGKTAAIGENLPVMIEFFVQDHNDTGRLNNLEW